MGFSEENVLFLHQLSSSFGPIYLPIVIKPYKICMNARHSVMRRYIPHLLRMCFCLGKYKLQHGCCCFSKTEISGLHFERVDMACIIQTHLLMFDVYHETFNIIYDDLCYKNYKTWRKPAFTEFLMAISEIGKWKRLHFRKAPSLLFFF